MILISIVILILGILTLLFVGFISVDYLSDIKSKRYAQIQKTPENEVSEEKAILNSDATTTQESGIGGRIIIPEEITDKPDDENTQQGEKTDSGNDITKAIPVEKNTFFIPNEKWIVKVSFAANKSAIFDTYYLYVHDFIYINKKFYVGTGIKNGIFLRGGNVNDKRGVAKKHGIIFYDQDAGLVYKDLVGGAFSYYRRKSLGLQGIHGTCAGAPYDDKNTVGNLVNMVKIIDGLELFVGKYVLTFINDGICIECEQHREIKDTEHMVDFNDLKKTVSENSKKARNGLSKGIGRWYKKNS